MKREKLEKRAIAAVKLMEAGYTIAKHDDCYRSGCYRLVDPDGEVNYVQQYDGEWAL